MRILFLTPRFPFPPDRGDRLFGYRLLETLVPHYEITLASFLGDDESEDRIEPVAKLGIEVHLVRRPRAFSWLQVLAALPGRDALQIAFYRSRRMGRLVDRLSRSPFDLAIAQMARMGPYGLRANARRRVVLLSDSIALSLSRRLEHESIWKRPLVRLEAERMAAYERRIVTDYDSSWLVSTVDRDHFPADLRQRLRVVPNGFPTEYLSVPLERPGRGRILFVGHLGVPSNVAAAEDLALRVLPALEAMRPGTHLRLVGADPAPAVRRLHDPPRVEVTGFVPDLRAEYANADVFVAPLRWAAGVQNKLIEAMACGLPVVTSTIAAEGLGAQSGVHLRTADGIEPTIEATRALLDDPVEARAMAARGRAHIEQNFSWEASLRALEEVLTAPPRAAK